MNAITPIIVLPIQRPQYMNAHITLETFERWFICNESALRRYWRDLQKYIDAKATVGEFVEWAQCQYDIAKSSSEPQQPMPGSPALVEGSSPTAGPGTAGAGSSSCDRLVIDQYRQAIYAHERLIEKLYDLMPERMDDAYDLVRAEYLAIHGPRD
jgi:hypothetical protein